jgi:hypothetical protein
VISFEILYEGLVVHVSGLLRELTKSGRIYTHSSTDRVDHENDGSVHVSGTNESWVRYFIEDSGGWRMMYSDHGIACYIEVTTSYCVSLEYHTHTKAI